MLTMKKSEIIMIIFKKYTKKFQQIFLSENWSNIIEQTLCGILRSLQSLSKFTIQWTIRIENKVNFY